MTGIRGGGAIVVAVKLKQPTSEDPLPTYEHFKMLQEQIGNKVEFDGTVRTLAGVEWFPCAVSHSPQSPRLPFIAVVFEGDKGICHSVVVSMGAFNGDGEGRGEEK